MRVIAGELKGRRLVVPRGRTTRPTADQVRIACLDTLMPYLPDGPFLDLFAGAGGVGIEALSRGAPTAVFVEDDARALRALRENLDALALTGRARVVRGDAARALDVLAGTGARFAVVFLDPLCPRLLRLRRGPSDKGRLCHGLRAPRQGRQRPGLATHRSCCLCSGRAR